MRSFGFDLAAFGMAVLTLASPTASAFAAHAASSGFERTRTPPVVELALKLVAYRSPTGRPQLSESAAERAVAEINEIYRPCGVRFRLEEYDAPRPLRLGLAFRPAKMSELNSIRARFDDERRLTVIVTGEWNSRGGLGADGANAWTTLPGGGPMGTVIEASAAHSPALLAHELAHALDLEHRPDDRQNLMHPVLYPDTRSLAADQCRKMRKTARQRWVAAWRPLEAGLERGLAGRKAK